MATTSVANATPPVRCSLARSTPAACWTATIWPSGSTAPCRPAALASSGRPAHTTIATSPPVLAHPRPRSGDSPNCCRACNGKTRRCVRCSNSRACARGVPDEPAATVCFQKPWTTKASMERTVESSPAAIDTEGLALDQGALLLLRRALAALPARSELRVRSCAPAWTVHLAAWCRQQGHGLRFEHLADGTCDAWVTRAAHAGGQWSGALTTGPAWLVEGELPAAEAAPSWGLAARGAIVEAGSPPFAFALSRRDELWATTAGALYRQAAAAQWNPEGAIDWNVDFELAP